VWVTEGEQKKSTQTVLSLEAISYARVLQSAKIINEVLFNNKQLILTL
jgi:hypothetical protein